MLSGIIKTLLISVLLATLAAPSFSQEEVKSFKASNGTVYEKERPKPVTSVKLREGDSIEILPESCSTISKTFFYKKESCIKAKVVTMKDGAIKESGEEKYQTEELRLEMIATLIGITYVMFLMVMYRFSVLIVRAAICIFVSVTGLAYILTIISLIMHGVPAITSPSVPETIYQIGIFTLFLCIFIGDVVYEEYKFIKKENAKKILYTLALICEILMIYKLLSLY